MSRLEEIKNEVVKEFGYKDFITYERLMIDSYDFDDTIIIEKIAKSYAKECVKVSLEKASEELTNHLYELGQIFTEQQVIIYPENIVLL